MKSDVKTAAPPLDPLNGLVRGLLERWAPAEASAAAFERLVAHFHGKRHGWIGVRDAKPETVAVLLGDVPNPRTLGARVQRVLKEISDLRGGNLSLEFLLDLPPTKALSWVESIVPRDWLPWSSTEGESHAI